MLAVPAYTLPKAEYFLTEHINSLLGLTIQDDDAGQTGDKEEQVASHSEIVQRRAESSDDEDMPETVREASSSAINSSASYDQTDNLDHNFDFLAESVKIVKSMTPGARKTAGPDKLSAYASMCQLYQKMRSDTSGWKFSVFCFLTPFLVRGKNDGVAGGQENEILGWESEICRGPEVDVGGRNGPPKRQIEVVVEAESQSVS